MIFFFLFFFFAWLISSPISDFIQHGSVLRLSEVTCLPIGRLFQRSNLSPRQPSYDFTHSSPEIDCTARSLQPRMQTCQISGTEQETRNLL